MYREICKFIATKQLGGFVKESAYIEEFKIAASLESSKDEAEKDF